MNEEKDGYGESEAVSIVQVANGYLLRPLRGDINYRDSFVFTSKETLADWIRIHGITIPPVVDKKVEDLPF